MTKKIVTILVLCVVLVCIGLVIHSMLVPSSEHDSSRNIGAIINNK